MSQFPGIESKSVHDRVQAVKTAGLQGTPEDVPRLLEIARLDNSPGVRLAAAAAAADVLSRHRTGAAAANFTAAQKFAVLDAFKGLDPGVNPSLFAALGALGGKKALARILIGVRDPRFDVRNGAAVGLLRYCVSWDAAGDESLRDQVIALLDDVRLRPDALASVLEICAACGWQDVRPALARYLGREDQLGQAAERAQERLDLSADPSTIEGNWLSDGRDAAEVNPEPGTPAWLILRGDLGLEAGSLSPIRWRMESGTHLRMRRGNERVDRELRRMWLTTQDNQEPAPALQMEGRTYRRATPADVIALAELLLDSGGGVDRRRREEVAELVLPLLPETLPGRRAAALLQISVGRYQDALERLDGLMKGRKKVSPDLYFHLGEALAGVERMDEAREAWNEYLERAGKRGVHITKARRRLEK